MARDAKEGSKSNGGDVGDEVEQLRATVDRLQAALVRHDDSEMHLPAYNGPRVGDEVLVRTATIYHHGKIVSISGKWIELEDPFCVISTGELSAATKSKKWQNSERMWGRVLIAMGGVIDVTVLK